MTKTLEIYNNGVRVMIEDGVVPIQFIFKNEFNKTTGYAIISVNQLKEIILTGDNDSNWYKAVYK